MPDNVNEKIKELVIARLRVLPPDASISLGSIGEFNKDMLIQHVNNNDYIGKKITEIELEYLRLLKENIFYAEPSNY